MTQEVPGGGAALNHTRQVTIDALCEHFANDAMTMEDFEARVDIAHRATTNGELRALLNDLPSGDLPAVAGSGVYPVPGRPSPVAVRGHAKETGYAVAILGGSRRKGRWSPAGVNYSIAVMGGVELDFREAALPAGVTELKAYSLCGGVDIIVPPGLVVESHGIGILGGFDHAGDSPEPAGPGAPVLRVSGIALMGGVNIHVRQVGESAGDARRRRRQERRARRRALRSRARDLADEFERLGE